MALRLLWTFCLIRLGCSAMLLADPPAPDEPEICSLVAQALGKDHLDKRTQKVRDAIGAKPRAIYENQAGKFAFRHQFVDQGIELSFSPTGVLRSAAFRIGDGQNAGFRGRLPKGLSFHHSPDQVRASLGEPVAISEGKAGKNSVSTTYCYPGLGLEVDFHPELYRLQRAHVIEVRMFSPR